MAQAAGVLVLLAACDALLFAGVYALMRSEDADFSCAFTCTVGESVGRGLLRLSMVAGVGLAVAAAGLLVVAVAAAVLHAGGRSGPPRSGRGGGPDA